MTELAVQCQRCCSHNTIPPYVDVPCPTTVSPLSFSPSTRPTYCPRCGHTRVYRPYDYADILCTDYLSLTRPLALAILSEYRELSDRGYKGFGGPGHDILTYVSLTKGYTPMPLRAYIAPVTCVCRACGGSFTMLRGHTDLQRTVPTYCVWCGAKHSPNSTQPALHINPEDPTATSWTVLSLTYSLSIEQVQYFYQRWSSTPVSSFSIYMSSPDVLIAIQALQLVGPLPLPAPAPTLAALPYCPPVLPAPACEVVPLSTHTSLSHTEPMYSTCGICGCEQPNTHTPSGRLSLSFKPYCEPCTLTVTRQRTLARS